MNRSLPIRWGLVVATLASLALIVALRRHEPSMDEKTAPMPIRGATGQTLEARNFSVKVGKLKLARAYLLDPRTSDGPVREAKADGIWLSALAEVTVTQANGYVGAQLRARDGRVYRAAPAERPDLKGFNLTDLYLVTGLPANGAYVFDVPIDALEGATLQFFSGNSAPAQLDHLADVDVGLDAAHVKTLLDAAAPMLDLRSPERAP
ncbi:hypothetical protein ACQQ2N_13330 [Dokdonella sp. MW10]|uniref:hypothetical protein n=1 Tax=Dokdonella sp. MW10 TaxID=2992926 RepID=UPI003F7CF103